MRETSSGGDGDARDTGILFLFGVPAAGHGGQAEQVAWSVDTMKFEVESTCVAHYLAYCYWKKMGINSTVNGI